MKKLSLLLFALLWIATLSGCGDDEEVSPINENILQLDGENFDSPSFATGVTYEAAAYYSSTLTSSRVGKSLNAVQVYLATIPNNMTIYVYGENPRGTSPGSVLATKSVSGLRSAGQWVTINLDSPVSITGEGVWIGVRVSHPSTAQIIGCDEGPAVAGGDWLARDGSWQTFRTVTGNQVSINWNIRGVLE